MGELAIEIERGCEAPVERLWSALVTPKAWWGENVCLEPQPGGVFHEPWRDVDGEHHTRGQVLIIEAPSCLRLSWRDDDWDFATDVTFSLSKHGNSSRLILRHDGWHQAAAKRQAQLIRAHREGWNMHLTNLINHAEQTM